MEHTTSSDYGCEISENIDQRKSFIFSLELTRILELIPGKKTQNNSCKFVLLLQINNNLRHPDEMFWSHVSMCILNGGGIRSPIDEQNNGMLPSHVLSDLFSLSLGLLP